MRASRRHVPAAVSYAMSLDDQRRSALRERIRSALSAADDGTIVLAARAGRWGTARTDQYAKCLMRGVKGVALGRTRTCAPASGGRVSPSTVVSLVLYLGFWRVSSVYRGHRVL